MLSNVAGQDVPMALAEAIYRQTEGNPLFIQEVARYLAEAGLIRREGGQWVAVSADSLLAQIPEGLRDVIGKRLSRLSEECNRVLSIAAVMGRDFSLDVLREVAGVPEEELLGAIEEAIGVSLLEEHTQGRDVRYRFTHAYFRQTLYGEMIAPRRLRLHNDVAKALETSLRQPPRRARGRAGGALCALFDRGRPAEGRAVRRASRSARRRRLRVRRSRPTAGAGAAGAGSAGSAGS